MNTHTHPDHAAKLLALCARATGDHIVWIAHAHEPHPPGSGYWMNKQDTRNQGGWLWHWNPFENDADALQLAIHTGAVIYSNRVKQHTVVLFYDGPWHSTITWGDDKMRDTRRAVVEAVAMMQTDVETQREKAKGAL